MIFKNSDECLKWVMSRRKKNQRADSFRTVMAELGNPQDDFRSLHVTGTNGKGSTCAFLESLLMKEGYRVGSFHSPHYLTHLDRIRINNRNIDGADFLRLVEANAPLIEKYDLGMFDIDFVVMCQYFREEKVDVAIIEAGIGGLHDASNVLHSPEIGIISSVGFDHMELLGNTLEAITADKAEIAKANSMLLVGNLPESCKKVASAVAEKKRCAYRELAPVRKVGIGEFVYQGEVYRLDSYADYQLENAALALEAKAYLFAKWGRESHLSKDKEALWEMKWPGRFEVIHDQPTVIVDGAHNPQAIEAMLRSLDNLPGRKAVLFAALKRKQVDAMVTMLQAKTDEVLLTSFDFPQALRYEEIPYPNKVADWKEGLARLCNRYDVVVICGSLYFLSEVAQTKDSLFLGK